LIRDSVKKLVRKSYEEESDPLREGILDCALGRNSFGVSEKVIKFAKQYDWSYLWHHPDTSYKDLKQEICRFWSPYVDLKIANVKVANGSCVVLSRLSKLFIESGAKVLGYVPQFREYMFEVKVLGGTYKAVPLDPQENFRFKPDKILREIKRDYCLIYIDNPNNPTGQFINLSDIEAIVKEAARKDTMVIVDEAYADYIEEKFSAVNLTLKYQNLMVTRTFTKGYGVGQFRVGYAILPTGLGDYYNKIELPFSVSVMGATLAREAILDQSFVGKLRQQVNVEKGKLMEGLIQRGYSIAETHPSCPIFIVGHKDKDVDLMTYFLSKRILTESGNDYKNLGKNYVRINTPPSAEGLLSKLDSQ